MSVCPELAGGGGVTSFATEPPGSCSDLPVDWSSVFVVKLFRPFCGSWNTVQHGSWTAQGEPQGGFWVRTSKMRKIWWRCLGSDLRNEDRKYKSNEEHFYRNCKWTVLGQPNRSVLRNSSKKQVFFIYLFFVHIQFAI